jgi:hypothetical protein
VAFKKAYDSVRRKVLYNILIKFGTPMKLLRPKYYLNETYMKIRIRKHLCDVQCSSHAVQGRASSRLLSKNVESKVHKTIILPVVLYGCENWSFTLREEHRLRVFDNRVLRGIFGPERDEVTGGWRKFIMRSSIVCTLHQILLG